MCGVANMDLGGERDTVTVEAMKIVGTVSQKMYQKVTPNRVKAISGSGD